MSGKTPIRMPKLSEELEQMIEKLKNDLEKKEALHQNLDQNVERIEKILSSPEFICIEDGALLFQMVTKLREIICKQGVRCEDYKNLVLEFVKKVFYTDKLGNQSKEIGRLTMSLQDPKFRSSPDKLQDILKRICDLLVKFEWTSRMKKIKKLTALDDIRQMVVETQKILLDQAKPKSKKKRPKTGRTHKISKSKPGIQRSFSEEKNPTRKKKMKIYERSTSHTDYESGYDSEPETQQDIFDWSKHSPNGITSGDMMTEVKQVNDNEQHIPNPIGQRGSSNNVYHQNEFQQSPEIRRNQNNPIQTAIGEFPKNQLLKKSTKSDESQKNSSNGVFPAETEPERSMTSMSHDSGAEIYEGNTENPRTEKHDKSSQTSENKEVPDSLGVHESDLTRRFPERAHKDWKATYYEMDKPIDIVIDECNAEEVSVQLGDLAKKIRKGSGVINKLEILDSQVKREHLVQLLKQLEKYYARVREFSIEHISDQIINLIPDCCRIIKECKTRRLNLEFNNLQDAEISSLQDNLNMENNLDAINISYNENVSPTGFFQLGKFVVKHSLKKFYGADCNMSDDSLEQFINGMKHAKAEQASPDEISGQNSKSKRVEKFEGNPRNKEINTQTIDDKQTVLTQPAYEPTVRTPTRENQGISDEDLQKLRTDSTQYAQLEELDISYSKNLTSKGFTHLAELVRNKAVRRLKLSGFQLTAEKLGAFFTQLGADQMIEGSKPKEMLVEDLEVSYNYTMEPEAYKILGQLVIFCGVKKLSLAGCGVNEEHLKHLREQTKNYKMTSLDASDNSSIGIGVIEIAKIVNESNLEELDLSQCSLVSSELKDFREALGNATLRQLNLSDFGRDPNERYVTEVRQLLPHITEKLILEWKTLRKRFRDQLQFALDNRESELQIVLNEESGELLERNIGKPSQSSPTNK